MHPLELVHEAGRPLLLLEDFGGEPLDRLPGSSIELGHLLRLAIGIVAALGKAHQRGILHMDIKPANILMNRVVNGFIQAYKPVTLSKHRPIPP